jgi:stearoyl-CoA desaturase (delta-9 desaturase)
MPLIKPCIISTNRLSSIFILGWAFDLKTVSAEMIRRRVLRTGDGSHKLSKINNDEELLKTFINGHLDANGNYIHNHDHEDSIWGYNDEMMKNEDKKLIKVLNKH